MNWTEPAERLQRALAIEKAIEQKIPPEELKRLRKEARQQIKAWDEFIDEDDYPEEPDVP